MEYRSKSNGWQTFWSHGGFSLIVSLIVVVDTAILVILPFFSNLNGRMWIYFFLTAMTLLISGASLIIRAKIPGYRSGQFFTFGIKSVPDSFATYYRWGWRMFLLGAALSFCLLLSRQ